MAPSFWSVPQAQAQKTDFPSKGSDTASCTEVDWNQKMRIDHPRLIDGCQEVVSAGGLNWARFEALFNRINSDGTVSFKIRDDRQRIIDTVAFKPTAGQVAYINDRPLEFRRLNSDQLVNLYVPEGEYGFATSVDVPVEDLATVIPMEPAPPALAINENRDATAQPTRQRLLPATASSMPWVALVGGFLMAASLGMMVLRRNG